jgi:hypothetical protein
MIENVDVKQRGSLARAILLSMSLVLIDRKSRIAQINLTSWDQYEINLQVMAR